MLQYYEGGWGGVGLQQWRDSADTGGLVVDWDLRTSLEGLCAAGGQIFASGDHAYAAATGRYAGRKAAAYALSAREAAVDRRPGGGGGTRGYGPVAGGGGNPREG